MFGGKLRRGQKGDGLSCLGPGSVATFKHPTLLMARAWRRLQTEKWRYAATVRKKSADSRYRCSAEKVVEASAQPEAPKWVWLELPSPPAVADLWTWPLIDPVVSEHLRADLPAHHFYVACQGSRRHRHSSVRSHLHHASPNAEPGRNSPRAPAGRDGGSARRSGCDACGPRRNRAATWSGTAARTPSSRARPSRCRP